ncbi:hypothetical protein BS78_09G217700 [Paspalum vaginatum]|nr:hypothetical protein BS78_09G217700 [Paspalum vaginatum]
MRFSRRSPRPSPSARHHRSTAPLSLAHPAASAGTTLSAAAAAARPRHRPSESRGRCLAQGITVGRSGSAQRRVPAASQRPAPPAPPRPSMFSESSSRLPSPHAGWTPPSPIPSCSPSASLSPWPPIPSPDTSRDAAAPGSLSETHDMPSIESVLLSSLIRSHN